MWKKADPSYPPDVDPGELRHRITLLQQSTVADATGTKIIWTAASPPVIVWAKIDPIHAADVIKGGQDVSQVRITVTIRYRPGIVASMRIEAPGGNIYVIEAIENALEMNIWLVMTCLAIGPNQ